MDKYIELSAFPIENIDLNNSSPWATIINHIDSELTLYIRVFYIKDNNKLRCIVGVEEDIVPEIIEIFNSCGYIIKPYVDNMIENLQSNIIVQRKVFRNIKDNYLKINEIYERKNANTLNYILSNLSNNSGIMFYIGHLQENPIKDPLDLSRTALKVPNRFVYQSDLLEKILGCDKRFEAVAFVFGKEEEQIALAKELSYIIRGWDYYKFCDSLLLMPEAINKFLNEFKISDLYNDFRLATFLRIYTEQEFNYILSAIDAIKSNPLVTPNLDTLWENESREYFIQKSNRDLIIGHSLYSDENYYLSRKKLRQGLLIVGAPGSGKGNQLFYLINQLKDVPLLIFESAKQEMHHLKETLDDLQTWRPVSGQFLFNPFEIPEGIQLNEYRASLIQMLKTCFRLDGPLEELFTSTLNRCFYKNNYSDSSKSSDENVSKWGLYEFIIEYSKMIINSGYSDRTKDDMRQAGLTRLKSLLDSNPDVFDTTKSIPITDFLGIGKHKHNLVQLNSLPTIDAKQSFATMLLIALGAYMQLKFGHCSDQEELKLVIVMDESHNLLKSINDVNGESYSFADDFANLMLTLRSVGVGFIISDQTTYNIPKVIADTCDSKMFMGSSKFSGISEYLDFLGADNMLLNNLYRMNAGEGVFSMSNSPHCVIFKTENIIDSYHLNTDGEFDNTFSLWPTYKKTATFSECNLCPNSMDTNCNISVKQSSRVNAQKLLMLKGNPFNWDLSSFLKDNKGDKEKYKNLNKNEKVKYIGLAVRRYIKLMKIDNFECFVIQWIRLCNLEFHSDFVKDDFEIIIKICRR